MRRSLLIIATLLGLLVFGNASGAPFNPKVNEPKTYKEVLQGVKELRDNIDGVMCGGWELASHVVPRPIKGAEKPGDCNVVIKCQTNQCGMYGAYANGKNGKGEIEICVSNAGGRKGATDILAHELTHALQECPFPPGYALEQTPEACCQAETEAYRTQCSYLASQGKMQGTNISVEECAVVGASYISCANWGNNVCGAPNTTPARVAQIEKIINTGAGQTCAQEVAHPGALVQGLKDAIKLAASGNDTSLVSYQAVNFPQPQVTGAPGRPNVAPLGNITSGTATRGSFQYPSKGQTGDQTNTEDNSGAWGFVTACDITKAGAGTGALTTVAPADPILGLPPLKVYLNPDSLCLKTGADDKRTVANCKKLYKQLQALYEQHKGRIDSCNVPVQFCFSPAYTHECSGFSCRTADTPRFNYSIGICDLPRGIVYRKPQVLTNNQASFYRHYDIDVKANATNQWKLRGECYGYYKENDPLTHVTFTSDEQCELTFRDNPNAGGASSASSASSQGPPDKAHNPEWQPVKTQKGLYKPDASLFSSADDVRAPRSTPAPWVADKETNLSILDMAKVRDANKDAVDPNDILPYVSLPLPVREVASKATPANSHTDAFDDTGKRSIVAWWEAQQKELMKLTRQPVVRLLLPSRFLTGLSQDDPLLKFIENKPSKSNGTTAIAVQAGGDELGSVLASLKQTFFLPTQEVRVPIIVPLLSESEANARIADWQLWQKQNPTCDATHKYCAKDAVPFIKKIESYRDSAKRVRELRGAMPQYVTNIFEIQKSIRGFYADWYVQNARRLLGWSNVAQKRQQLLLTWKQIARSLLETADCMAQWCSNQRYSVPIYSLLDGWTTSDTSKPPTRSAADLVYNGQPLDLRTLKYTQPSDLSFDFSWLSISGSTLPVPVLWPVQVKVDLPLPPGYPVTTMPDIKLFPDLPEYKDPYATILGSFKPPPFTLPKDIVDNKDGTYRFDKKYLIPEVSDKTNPLSPQDDAKLDSAQAMTTQILLRIAGATVGGDRRSLEGSYCRFTKSILETPDPDKANPKMIVHVENDLQERVARLFSRIMPSDVEDFLGKKVRLAATNGVPCKNDSPCTKLPGEKRQSFKWGLLLPSMSADFSALYQKIRTSVLPDNEDKNPYADTPLATLKRTMPNIKLPSSINLLPMNSSSPPAP